MTRRTRSYRRARQSVTSDEAACRQAKQQHDAAQGQQRADRFFADRWAMLQYQWAKRRPQFLDAGSTGRQKGAVSCYERDTVTREGERRHEPCRCNSGRRADRCCRNQPVYKCVDTRRKPRPEPEAA